MRQSLCGLAPRAGTPYAARRMPRAVCRAPYAARRMPRAVCRAPAHRTPRAGTPRAGTPHTAHRTPHTAHRIPDAARRAPVMFWSGHSSRRGSGLHRTASPVQRGRQRAAAMA